MEVVRFRAAPEFLAEVRSFLVAREAEHNLILGLCAKLERNPRANGEEQPYLARVVSSGETLCVAVRTPPYPLVLSEAADASAVDTLAEDAALVLSDLTAVNGPTNLARRFADAWSRETGRAVSLGMSQRILAAEEASTPAGVPGHLRKATDDDRDLLVSWVGKFLAEALRGAFSQDPDAAAEDYLSRPGDEGAYVWEHRVPVSFAVCGGPTPNGIRVGPVYTPPARRGRGYASALVAELTQRLLGAGRRFCFLYTDLANPTSNRIYERIGYRAVTDVQEFRLG